MQYETECASELEASSPGIDGGMPGVICATLRHKAYARPTCSDLCKTSYSVQRRNCEDSDYEAMH